jgi:hypothetical protein
VTHIGTPGHPVTCQRPRAVLPILLRRSSASAFQQLLYTDHFYKDMERRVYKEGVQVRRTPSQSPTLPIVHPVSFAPIVPPPPARASPVDCGIDTPQAPAFCPLRASLAAGLTPS